MEIKHSRLLESRIDSWKILTVACVQDEAAIIKQDIFPRFQATAGGHRATLQMGTHRFKISEISWVGMITPQAKILSLVESLSQLLKEHFQSLCWGLVLPLEQRSWANCLPHLKVLAVQHLPSLGRWVSLPTYGNALLGIHSVPRLCWAHWRIQKTTRHGPCPQESL